MSAPNIATYTNSYKVPKGRVLFDQLIDGVYQGYRPFGNCPAFAITVATTKEEHKSSEGGVEVVDFSYVKEIKRTAKITCDNMDIENQKLFLSADSATISQTATPVTDYEIPRANGGRVYQLGRTSSNPSGVRGVSSVAVRIKEGDDAAARVNSHTYAKGDFYVPATPNNHYYVCTVGGAAAGSIPTFSTDGSTFADGAATFKDMGLITVPSTANVNYRIDADLGLLSVVVGGTIDVANLYVAALAVDGLDGVGLYVDYTPAANSRTQLATSSSAKLSGRLKFLADNPYGENQDVELPSVDIAPSGDLSFVGDAISSVQMEVGINQLDSNTAAIYIDGRAV